MRTQREAGEILEKEAAAGPGVRQEITDDPVTSLQSKTEPSDTLEVYLDERKDKPQLVGSFLLLDKLSVENVRVPEFSLSRSIIDTD